MRRIIKKSLFTRGVIVFGAGYIGKMVLYMLEKQSVTVVGCFDNNPAKWRGGVEPSGSLSCEMPKLISEDIPILIAVEKESIKKEVSKQCLELGYREVHEIDKEQLLTEVNKLSDREYLELQFFLIMGETLDLKNPRTFIEKLQWLKLYDRKPIYMRMTDKLEAKKYVAGIIGEEYIIPTLGGGIALMRSILNSCRINSC